MQEVGPTVQANLSQTLRRAVSLLQCYASTDGGHSPCLPRTFSLMEETDIDGLPHNASLHCCLSRQERIQ